MKFFRATASQTVSAAAVNIHARLRRFRHATRRRDADTPGALVLASASS